MCLPAAGLAYLTLAAQAASSVMQYQGQQAQADYTNKANDIAKQQFTQEENEQRMDGERQRQQEYQQSASEVNQHQAEALRSTATLDALLGEYGGGNTSDRRMAALGIRQGQDFATLADNATKRQAELGFAESAAIGQTRSKLASLRPGEQPSMSGLGLSLASSALTFKSRYDSATDPYGYLRKQKRELEEWKATPQGQFMRGHGTSGD